MKRLLVCSYLEPELIERIRAVSAEVEVDYHPELLPRPRYQADHIGIPLERSEAERRAWHQLMEVAEILFDFDYADIDGMRSHARAVRWIQASSAGIGQFVRRHRLDELGAIITTAAGVHARPLAEFALWGMLTFVKNYPQAQRQQREHLWRRFHNDDLEGKTVAIVGLGQIGRELARMLRFFGMRVLATKRTAAGLRAEELGVDALYRPERLHEMLAHADFVVLVAPHTDQTVGMIDAAALGAMKPGSVLINIGRGALVVEEALLDALSSGHLSGAVLDVVAHEPLAADHPLWELENVFVFPHSASTSRNENWRLVELFCDNLERYLTGRELRNVFDPERQY